MIDVRNPPGILFHAEFYSADASAPANEAAARMTLYEAGTGTEITLAADDQVCLTSVSGASLVTMAAHVFDGDDEDVDAGEIVTRFEFVSVAVWHNLIANVPFVCRPGSYPKVRSSAIGQVDVFATGYIRRPNP